MFQNEPGEGSGVARSFYTSLAEALLVNAAIPNLEPAQAGTQAKAMQLSLIQRLRGNRTRAAGGKRSSGRDNRLNYDARPFYMNGEGGSNDHLSSHQIQLGERLYPRVQSLRPSLAGKITGIALQVLIEKEKVARRKV